MNRLNGAMLDDLRAEVGALYSAADHIGYLLRVPGAPDRAIYSASAVRTMADMAGAFWLDDMDAGGTVWTHPGCGQVRDHDEGLTRMVEEEWMKDEKI